MRLEGIQKQRVEIEVDGKALLEAVESAIYTKFPRLQDHCVNGDGYLRFQGIWGMGADGAVATLAESSAARVLQELSEIIGDVK